MADPIELDLSAWLLSRDETLGTWAGPSRLKRLGGSGEVGYSTESPIALDRGRMRISGICTSERLDRSREIVRSKGLDVSDHQTNPIFTIGHGWKDPNAVVGRCEVDGRYTVRPGAEANGATPFTAQFFQTGPAAERAEQAFALIDSGVLRGVSIGFLIPPGGSNKITAEDGYPALEIVRAKVFEVTTVPVGDNPDAIVRIVEKGFGGRPLLPEYAAMLKPLIPPRRTMVRVGRREKTMDAPGQTAPTQPAPQQQPPAPAEQGPPIPPSAQHLSNAGTYLVGFLKFLKQEGARQEHPAVKTLMPILQLHLSEAFRAVANTYGQLQAEYPDIPPLPGAGSLLAVAPEPEPMAGDDLGAEAPIDDMGGVDTGDSELGFDDGFDDAEDSDLYEGGDDDADDQVIEDDEDDEEAPVRTKSMKRDAARAMVARSERVLDAFWEEFARELDATDVLRLKQLDAILATPVHKLTPQARREARQLGNQLREKAASGAGVRQKAPSGLDAAEVAAATQAAIAEQLKPTKDAIFQMTGKDL